MEGRLTPEDPRSAGAVQPPLDHALQDSIGTASSRIQVVIEAAEKAAAGIIDDAEAQARIYLLESRRRAEMIADQRAREVASMTDALIESAEAAKRQSDQLLAVLDQAKLKIDPALQVHLPEKPSPPEHGIAAAAYALSEAQHEVAQQPPAAQQPPVEPPPFQSQPPPGPPPVQAPSPQVPSPVEPPPFQSQPPPAPGPPPVEPQPPVGSPPPPGDPGSSREAPPVGTQWWSLKGSSRSDA